MTPDDEQTNTVSTSTAKCRPSCTARIVEGGDGTIDRTNRSVGRNGQSFLGDRED